MIIPEMSERYKDESINVKKQVYMVKYIRRIKGKYYL